MEITSLICNMAYIILFLAVAVQAVRFKGSCPDPPQSSNKLPPQFPNTLAMLAPLTSASAVDAPLFVKQSFGQKCEVKLTQTENHSFIMGHKNQCSLLTGAIYLNTEDAEYELIYKFSQQNKSVPLYPDCIRNWTFINRVSILAEEQILLLWICINNRPELGSYDAGVAAVPEGLEDKDYSIPILNQLTFSQLLPRHFINKKDRNCTGKQIIVCPIIPCPTIREGWGNNFGLLLWLGCFSVVSFVSSSFCGFWRSRRRTRDARRIQVVSSGPTIAWTE